jgi:hypothetical protein
MFGQTGIIIIAMLGIIAVLVRSSRLCSGAIQQREKSKTEQRL